MRGLPAKSCSQCYMSREMDADLHAVKGIAKLDHKMRTKALITGVLTRSFVESQPSLIRMLQSPTLDSSVVDSMVERLTAVRSGTSNIDDASTSFGQSLVDTYITPRLSYPPTR